MMKEEKRLPWMEKTRYLVAWTASGLGVRRHITWLADHGLTYAEKDTRGRLAHCCRLFRILLARFLNPSPRSFTSHSLTPSRAAAVGFTARPSAGIHPEGATGGGAGQVHFRYLHKVPSKFRCGDAAIQPISQPALRPLPPFSSSAS